MVMREKKCKHCQMYFFYDDGVDDNNQESESQRRDGFCPRCEDPHEMPGYSYDKEDILYAFKKYLKERDVAVEVLDNDTILSMLREFPRSFALYNSNGSFLTITLHEGDRFDGKYGAFQLGEAILMPAVQGKSFYTRQIKCVRCEKVVCYPKLQTLEFFLGINEKTCKSCDAKKIPKNLSGLNRNGSEKSEFSDRAMAKALNVSRMDYRRNKGLYTKPVPSLSPGAVSGVYTIKASYWDEDPSSYSPKYLIECTKCNQQFRILQKRIQDTVHYCAKEGRVIG